jgi:hypothetical protein
MRVSAARRDTHIRQANHLRAEVVAEFGKRRTVASGGAACFDPDV